MYIVRKKRHKITVIALVLKVLCIIMKILRKILERSLFIMGFIDEIKAKAKTCKKTIVLPESEDIRTYEAAEAILKEGTANLVLIGKRKKKSLRIKADFDITIATIVDPATYEKTDEYVATLVELRKKKGMTEEQAREFSS